MVKELVLPHILIDGRPRLTARLYKRCKKRKPLVLSANPILLSAHPAFRYVPRATQLFGTYLIRALHDEAAWGFRADLRDFLDRARDHFKLRPSERLRVICAGSHGSLWHNDFTNTGGHLDPEGNAYLEEALHNREYANALYRALSAEKDLKFLWLTDSFRLLPKDKSDYYRPVADLARQALESAELGHLCGAIPLLYSRPKGSGDPWQLFRNEKSPKPMPRPSRMTDRLLRQYEASPQFREGHQCVLVKLLPRARARQNPLDNPIVSTSELQQAYLLDIDAVLLDRRHGVVDREVKDHKERVITRVCAF